MNAFAKAVNGTFSTNGKSMDLEEIKNALKRANKGLTARQLLDQCVSYGDLQEIVKVIHALKTHGHVKADGMRDNQVVYKLGDWPASEVAVAEPAQTESTQTAAAPSAASRSRRSFAGLREGLWDMLDKQAAGNVEPNHAKAYANTAMAILKSLEVQLELERLRYGKQIPQTLDDMVLTPLLESK